MSEHRNEGIASHMKELYGKSVSELVEYGFKSLEIIRKELGDNPGEIGFMGDPTGPFSACDCLHAVAKMIDKKIKNAMEG